MVSLCDMALPDIGKMATTLTAAPLRNWPSHPWLTMQPVFLNHLPLLTLCRLGSILIVSQKGRVDTVGLRSLTTLPKQAQHPALTSLCSTWACFEVLPPILGQICGCCDSQRPFCSRARKE